MKKLLFMLSALVSAAFAQAAWTVTDDPDNPDVRGVYLTDGVWTFKGGLTTLTIDSNTYGLTVQDCTGYPAEVSALDFSQPVINNLEDAAHKGKALVINGYKINFGVWNGLYFLNENWTPSDAGARVGRLTLNPTDYSVSIDSSFRACPNIVFDLSGIPASTTSIGDQAFAASPVTGVLSSDGITVLGSYAFARAPGISGVRLPNVKSINDGAFMFATGLTSVEVGSALVALKQFVFTGCSSLECFSPFLPTGCAIAKNVFQDCSSLTNALIYSGADLPGVWDCFSGCSRIPSADLSQSQITTLSRYVFNGCTSLGYVSLPSTFTTFDNNADTFNGCSSLMKVDFRSVPNRLDQFAGCVSLGTVNFHHTGIGVLEAGIYDELPQTISTYLHLDDSETEALEQWAEMTEGGALSESSTWARAMIGKVDCEKRPLLRYSTKHVSIAPGQNGTVIERRPGTFIVSRAEGDSVFGDLVVNYTISGGTAVEGVHFVPLSGRVTIPSGEWSGVIEVNPIFFGYVGTETLTLSLVEGDYEIVAEEGEATISLSTESLRSVSIVKLVDADEGTGRIGEFLLSRGEKDSVGNSISVSLAYGGTAVAGQTYRPCPTVVTIPAGQKSARIMVWPKDDPNITVGVTVVAAIQSGDYVIDSTAASAELNVIEGATFGGWRITSMTSMTDGKWTFAISMSNAGFADDPDVYKLTINGCTGCPDEISELDFGKSIVNKNDSGSAWTIGRDFAIQNFNVKLSNDEAAGAKIGSIRLPDDDRHPFAFSADYMFKGLANLTSVEPFLPRSCTKLPRSAFQDCSQLVQKSLVFYGSDMGLGGGSWGGAQAFSGCTQLTNVDLSASTITGLRREAFNECTALRAVSLPPTLKEFGDPNGGSLLDRDPFPSCLNLKLIFSGSGLPVCNFDIKKITAMEFSDALTTLPDNAFTHYPNLTEILFRGAKPETVGADLFTGLTTANQLTAYVPRSKVATWKPVATDGIITKTKGEWISGTSQQIRTWADDHPGMVLIVR